MANPPEHISELAHKWLRGTITDEEREIFMKWYTSSDDGLPLHIPNDFATDELSHGMRMYKNIYEEITRQETSANRSAKSTSVLVITNKWFRYAASIILLLGLTIWYFNSPNTLEQKEVPDTAVPLVLTDVAPPSSSNALIKLADGSSLILDSLKNGTIAQQGKVKLVKQPDGQIAYQGTDNEIMYNTLINPRGSRVFSITLSDGTKVWLNSESSILYPTVFTGSERKVEITGEVYFEVAKKDAMPFRVKNEGMMVTVLGTHFNINTYKEEAEMKVTLLEGSVQVSSEVSGKTVQLKEGEQSQLSGMGNLTVSAKTDLETVMAWKNGKFRFDNKTDIGTIMREIARWYNVEVQYKGMVKNHFGGSISRDINLSQVLKVLESTGGVKFELDGKKVVIMP